MATTPATCRSILRKAVKILEQKGWCRYTYHDEHGRYCAIGALYEATKGCHPSPRLYEHVYRAVKATIPGELSIARWNDTKARGRRDVIAKFRAAEKQC